MTLPYPNSPAITETVNAIISNTKSNIDYLGTGAGNASGMVVKVISATPATASGDVTLTGVGFEPRLILFLFSGTYAEYGFGYYTTKGNSYTQYGVRNNPRIVLGTFSSDTWSWSIYPCYFTTNYDGTSNRMVLSVKETNSDGFVYTWTNVLDNLALDNYYVVAICFK